MRTILLSAWAWFAISLLVIVWLPLMFVVHLFDRDPSSYHTGRWFRRLGSAMTRVNPAWKVVVSGHLPENPRNPYVVVANHQSLADIPVVSRLPWDMKWVGKESLFHLPLIGWMMRVSNDIPVVRGDRRSRAMVFIEARKRLANRVSVMIMPEGTRSPDGRLRPFSDGPFKLAMREAIPVLPIAVDGTFSALPTRSWKFESKSSIRVHVFDPILPGDWDSNGTGMRDHVRSLIRAKLANWRGISEAEVDNSPLPEFAGGKHG
jgi:1-acyl-sn-glycerol-3-phosphate acyltransferase